MELDWAFSLPPDLKQCPNREDIKNARIDATKLLKDNVGSPTGSLPPCFIGKTSHKASPHSRGEKVSATTG